MSTFYIDWCCFCLLNIENNVFTVQYQETVDFYKFLYECGSQFFSALPNLKRNYLKRNEFNLMVSGHDYSLKPILFLLNLTYYFGKHSTYFMLS